MTMHSELAAHAIERAGTRTAQHAFRLPEAADGLWQVAAREGADVGDLTAALVAMLARRYTRQDEIALEGVMARVPDTAADRMTVTVPLERRCTFRSLLTAARDARDGAAPHHDILIGRSALPNSATFELPDPVTETLHRVGRHFGLTAGLDEGHRPNDRAIGVTCIRDGDCLQAVLVYEPEIYDSAAMEHLANHLCRLAAAAGVEPDAEVDVLPMLTPDEWRTIVVDWNAADTDARPTCIHEDFEAQAAAAPGAPALLYQDRTVTFAQLNEQANRLARVLRAHGIGPEQLVGVCLDDPIEVVVAVLAILKAGAGYVPFNAHHPAAHLQQIIDDARVATVITHTRLASEIPMPEHVLVCLDRLPDAIAGAEATNLAVPVSPDNVAYIVYTSGSTGSPKGVIGVHRSITNGIRVAPRFDGTEINSLNASLSFGSAVAGLFMPLLRGRPIVIVAEEHTGDLPRLIDAWSAAGVNRLVMVAPQLRQLLALGPETISRLPGLAWVALSGATLSPDLIAAFFAAFPNARLGNSYGSTETAGMATRRIMTATTQTRGVSIGRQIATMRVYLLDRDLNPVPVGIPGEMFVGSANLARGYLFRPAVTAERFVPDPFANDGSRMYRTGDLARYLENGEIEFLGRTDFQVKIRGIRIEPGEIEAVLARHADVEEAVAVAQHLGDQSRLIAYVVPRAGARLVTSDLRQFVGERLPEYMVPAIFVAIDRLPVTPRGKIDRRALPVPSPTRPELETPYAPPQRPEERRMAQLWGDALRVDHVGIDDHWLELGGDSLIATQLVGAINREFQVELTVLDLLARPTITALLRHLPASAPSVTTQAPVSVEAPPARAEALVFVEAPVSTGATPSGGIDRSMPEDTRQQHLLNLCRAVLHRPAMNIDDDFSLELLSPPQVDRLLELVNRTMLSRLSAADLAKSPTVRQLAAQVVEWGKAEVLAGRVSQLPQMPPNTRAPETPTQDQICAVWESLLERSRVLVDEDFFELGGTAALATRMVDRVERLCGPRVSIENWEGPLTVRHIAERLHEALPGDPLRLVQAGAANTPPLLMLHGDMGGGGHYVLELARALGADRPVYSVNTLGADGEDVPGSVYEIAAAHARQLSECLPDGRVHLAGYCIGAIVAWELARQLTEGGRDVVSLLLAEPAFKVGEPDLVPPPRASREARCMPGVRWPWLIAEYAAIVQRSPCRRYEGPTTVFWATEGQRLTDKPARREGLRSLLPNVTMERCPGAHTTMLGRHVATVGARMRESLLERERT